MGLWAARLSKQIRSGSATSTWIIGILTLLDFSCHVSIPAARRCPAVRPKLAYVKISHREALWLCEAKTGWLPAQLLHGSGSQVSELQPSYPTATAMESQKHRAKSFLCSWLPGAKGNNKIIVLCPTLKKILLRYDWHIKSCASLKYTAWVWHKYKPRDHRHHQGHRHVHHLPRFSPMSFLVMVMVIDDDDVCMW